MVNFIPHGGETSLDRTIGFQKLKSAATPFSAAPFEAVIHHALGKHREGKFGADPAPLAAPAGSPQPGPPAPLEAGVTPKPVQALDLMLRPPPTHPLPYPSHLPRSSPSFATGRSSDSARQASAVPGKQATQLQKRSQPVVQEPRPSGQIPVVASSPADSSFTDRSQKSRQSAQELSASMEVTVPGPIDEILIPEATSALQTRNGTPRPTVPLLASGEDLLSSNPIKPPHDATRVGTNQSPQRSPIASSSRPSLPLVTPAESNSGQTRDVEAANPVDQAVNIDPNTTSSEDRPLKATDGANPGLSNVLEGHLYAGQIPTQETGEALASDPTLNLPGLEAPPVAFGKDCQPPVGISAAQQETVMKKGEKVLKNAEPAEQILPGAGSLSAGLHQTVVSSPDSSTQAATVIGNPPGDSQLQTLAKTHELVATHALRLSHSQNDGMRVILEPASGTRLSLELRLTSAGIEAQAQLHRGDFDFLNNHWAELQQRLQPQGITLSALESPIGAGSDHSGPQDNRNFTHEEPARADAWSELGNERDPGETRSKTKTRIRHYAGWESWA